MNRMPDPAESLLPEPSPVGTARASTGGVAGGVSGAARDAARTAADAQATGQAPAEDDDGASAGRTAAGVAGGAVGGTLAGLQAGALAGAVTLGVGAVAGAMLGAAAGATLAQDADPSKYTSELDAHYRALYEGADRTAGYEAARPAYVFGHVAASEPALAGRSFEDAEPALERAWNDELRAQAAGAAAWPDVRRYARDAFGHARAEGAGARRTTGVVGSGGSAVDPVELDRARQGLPSTGA